MHKYNYQTTEWTERPDHTRWREEAKGKRESSFKSDQIVHEYYFLCNAHLKSQTEAAYLKVLL